MSFLRRAAAALLLTTFAVQPALARPRPALKVERVFLLYRHGVRAPLEGEAAIQAYRHPPLPRWSTPESLLTPHGAEALRRLGAWQRQEFAAAGLLPARGCPTAGRLAIWTNTVNRTITSGQALADGVAPGCIVPIGHLGPDAHDPLFEPLEAGAVPFDANAAVADILRYTGGATGIARPHAAAIRTFENILGCDTGPKPCDILNAPGEIAASADGKGIRMSGPIDITSGTAQVFLLQYLEGMPLAQVGWGRATPARLAEISRLHALLFDVHVRSPYMAPRIAGPMARRLLAALTAPDGTAVTLLVGHDNNIAALASLVRTHFQIPGYGRDDPPPGGAIGFELVREGGNGRQYVRAFYEAATPIQIRNLTRFGGTVRPARMPLTLGLCDPHRTGRCTLEAFTRALENVLVG